MYLKQQTIKQQTVFIKKKKKKVSVSSPVPKRTLRKWQMAESKTENKTVWVKKVVVALGDS